MIQEPIRRVGEMEEGAWELCLLLCGRWISYGLGARAMPR